MIHSEHPFATPAADRDPIRRLRGRLVAPVTVWATGDASRRAGLTVSSLMVAEGDPAELVGLINSDSDLADALAGTGTVAVSVLGWGHRQVADVFAGLAPSPGGLFRTGQWHTTEWGPLLEGATAWVGGPLIGSIPAEPPAGDETTGHTDRTGSPMGAGASQEMLKVGWSWLVRVRIDHLDITGTEDDDPDADGLALLRGAYHRPDP